MELPADPQSPGETDLGILGRLQQSWPEGGEAEEECRGTPSDYDSLDHEQVAKVESKILKMNV